MTAYLIGIAGPKGSGKTHIARMLERMDYRHVAFAAPIKRMLVSLYGHRLEFDGRKKEDPVMHGHSTRQLLQSLGDWGRNIDPDFWVRHFAEMREWVRKFVGDDVKFCIADVRYDNEADWIRAEGGIILRIEAEYPSPPRSLDIGILRIEVKYEYTNEHSSECGITPHPNDVVLDPSVYWGDDTALERILRGIIQ